MKLTGYEKTSIILAFIFAAIIIVYQSMNYVPNDSAVIMLDSIPASAAAAASSGIVSTSASARSSSKLSSKIQSSLKSDGEAVQIINVNTATKEQLMTIKGIGEVKAQSIIDDRALNGPFKTVDDLLRVKGIGETTLAKIKPYITVD